MRKTRGDNTRKVRVEIPLFEVLPASFTAIVGSNGSGKSTLLDILGLILSADHADEFLLHTDRTIRLDRLAGREKIHLRRNYISYVLQTGGLLEFLSIRQNISFAARLRNKSPETIHQVAEQLGIADILDKRPGKVSGGQRQKAAIARALVQEAPIILADEPTSALDTESAKELMATFRRLTDKTGSSLIMVTHDHDLARERADIIYRFRTEMVDEKMLSSILLPDPSLSSENV
ncbi:Putative ABC transport system ATP-binding protein [Candidatus Electrothrix laxa]